MRAHKHKRKARSERKAEFRRQYKEELEKKKRKIEGEKKRKKLEKSIEKLPQREVMNIPLPLWPQLQEKRRK